MNESESYKQNTEPGHQQIIKILFLPIFHQAKLAGSVSSHSNVPSVGE